jgi:hypothetical protein
VTKADMGKKQLTHQKTQDLNFFCCCFVNWVELFLSVGFLCYILNYLLLKKYMLFGALWTIVGRVIPRLYQLILLKWHFYKVQFDSNTNYIFSHFLIIGVLQVLLQRRSKGKGLIKVMRKQHWQGKNTDLK